MLGERRSILPRLTCASHPCSATPFGTENCRQQAGRGVPHCGSVLPSSTMWEPGGHRQSRPLHLPCMCTCHVIALDRLGCRVCAHHSALRVPALWAGLLQRFQACLPHDPPYSCGGVFVDLLQIVCSTSSSCVRWGSIMPHAGRQVDVLFCQVPLAAAALK